MVHSREVRNDDENGGEDEISLFDVMDNIRVGWRWPAGGFALGALGAAAAIVLLPAQYEAVAMIQVGQVGGLGQIEAPQTALERIRAGSIQIEAPQMALERIRSGGFQIEAARLSGDQRWIDAVATSEKTGEEYFSAQIGKGSTLIEIRAKAESQPAATRVAEAIVATLAHHHEKLAMPQIERLKVELAHAEERLQLVEKELSELNGSDRKAPGAAAKFDANGGLTVLNAIWQVKESELFARQQAVVDLRNALGEPATQPTKAIEPVFAPERPVWPKKGLLLTLGSIGGLFAGLLGLAIWQVARRWKTERGQAFP